MILVTGGTGFVGSALVSSLGGAGEQVAVIARKAPSSANWPDSVMVLEADITDPGSLEKIKALEFSAVAHLAAHIPPGDEPEDYEACFDVNVRGTRNILEFARERGIESFVNCSSAIVYGKSEGQRFYDESTSIVPETFYAMSKAVGEMITDRYARLYGLRASSLRLAYVYGRGMHEGFVFSRFLELARKGEDITLYGQGTGVRDFIYVKDVVRAIELALENELSGVYNVGTGRAISLSDIARGIISAMGSASALKCLNRPGEDASQPVLDMRRLKADTGFSPLFDIGQGVKDMIGEGS